MRVITNEELIENRRKWASRLSPLALFLLLGGLALNIFSMRSPETASPVYFYGTMGLLLTGFVTSTIASGLVNQWVREPRSDQILEQLLKGFDNKNTLLNYTLPTTPHILVGQSKVYSITTKGQDGDITVANNKWKRKFRFSDVYRFFANEGLGKPFDEAKHNAEALAKYIQEHFPDDVADEDLTIPIEPIIILTNSEVNLRVESTEIPTMKSGQLKAYLRQSAKGAALKANVRQKLVEILRRDV
ncbi:MAG TPA: hypothetical protein ENK24_06715 [Anaerolineae bacterium]|nr:hypothetical protein [Anaerolineae bacterium]